MFYNKDNIKWLKNLLKIDLNEQLFYKPIFFAISIPQCIRYKFVLVIK